MNEFTVGTSAMFTVTVADFGAHPVLAAVNVYVVGDEGETTREPEPVRKECRSQIGRAHV